MLDRVISATREPASQDCKDSNDKTSFMCVCASLILVGYKAIQLTNGHKFVFKHTGRMLTRTVMAQHMSVTSLQLWDRAAVVRQGTQMRYVHMGRMHIIGLRQILQCPTLKLCDVGLCRTVPTESEFR